MTLDDIKKALSDRNLAKVSESVGIPYTRLWRIASGKSERPSYQDVESLKAYLENN